MAECPSPRQAAAEPAAEPGVEPVLFEVFGEMWTVQARLGQGVSASVYRVSSGRSCTAAVKEFQIEARGGDYGFHKERSVLEDVQGHKNIVTLYGVFTNHSSVGASTRCLLLELLDVSVSELLLRAANFHRSQPGLSLWLVQLCGRDMLEALSFLHHKGYIHADLKPRNILWSPDDQCFKLIDFGLSFKEGNQDVKYIQTDGYRAPEAELQNSLAQAGVELGGHCTATVDLWSLGIVLLEMFSGTKLKEMVRSQQWEENSAAVIDHIFEGNSDSLPAIPLYHLRDLLKSLLQKNPQRRCTAEKALLNPFFSVPFAPHIEELVLLPSPVLRLLNLIDDTHLQDDDQYEDVLSDMREECEKYGSVVSLLIPKENPAKGQVFVEYSSSRDCREAQRRLSGRTFDGRFVVATFYPLSAYRRGLLYQTLQ